MTTLETATTISDVITTLIALPMEFFEMIQIRSRESLAEYRAYPNDDEEKIRTLMLARAVRMNYLPPDYGVCFHIETWLGTRVGYIIQSLKPDMYFRVLLIAHYIHIFLGTASRNARNELVNESGTLIVYDLNDPDTRAIWDFFEKQMKLRIKYTTINIVLKV